MKVLKEGILLEDEIEKAADAVDAEEVIPVPDEPDKQDLGMIWTELDKSLAAAQEAVEIASYDDTHPDGDYPNLLLIGGAGIGKTAQIKEWAKKRGVNLFMLQGSALDAADMGGLPIVDSSDETDKDGKPKKVLRAQKVGTGILDQLDRPNSVLFLDELNRARPDVRAALLTLICDHLVQDFTADGGMRPFPNFLFTVAAVNPSGKTGYDTYELDQAEMGRFTSKEVKAENAVWLRYAYNDFKEKAQKAAEHGNDALAAKCLARGELAKAIVGNASFTFDDELAAEEYEDNPDWNGKLTTPRNITRALLRCDGTKASLIDGWSGDCNNLQEPLIKKILNKYEDKIDKANSVLARGTDSPLLKKKAQSPMERMRKKFETN